MTRTENLTTLERDTMLRWFMERITMDDRHRLMTELPYHYAKLTGTSPTEWPLHLEQAIGFEATGGES